MRRRNPSPSSAVSTGLPGNPRGVTQPRAFAEHMATRAPLSVLALPFAVPPFRFSFGYGATRENDPGHRWFRSLFLDVAREALVGRARRKSSA